MAVTQLAENATQHNVEKTINFLDNVEAPASLVSRSGDLVHLNKEMALLVINKFNGSSLKCQWLSSHGANSCSDCNERSTLSESCFVMGESGPLSLLAAVRLFEADNTMLRIYRDSTSPVSHTTEDIIEKMMNFISHKTIDNIASPANDAREIGFTSTNLCNLVDSAINQLNNPKFEANNQVDPLQRIDSTSPMILRQIISNILIEFSRLEFCGPVTIRNMRQAGPMDDNMVHMLYFNAKSAKPLGKSKSSELTASGLRFKNLCRNIRDAIGLEISPPLVFQKNDTIEVHFSFQNQLSKERTASAFEDDPAYKSLSSREQEIVEMVRNGYDNIRISDKLGITHATVKQHLKAIYRKTEVRNRVELIFKNSQPYV